MITGDHVATAAAIAAEVGIHGRAVTGTDLDTMTDRELADQVDDIGVFARVTPAHKLAIVQALTGRGHPGPSGAAADRDPSGAVDPHVHLGKDIRVPRDPDDVLLETASAAAGGITSMLVYLMSGESYSEVAPAARAVMEESSRVDFGFHLCVASQEHVSELPGYIRDLGVSSFKFFMNFRGEEGAYLGLLGIDDGYMYDVLGTTADHGAMVNPHPENIELVWKLKGLPVDESGRSGRRRRVDSGEVGLLQPRL